MKEFFAWLFSQNNSDLTIGLFDAWHFLYLFIVFGTCRAIYGAYFALKALGKKRAPV